MDTYQKSSFDCSFKNKWGTYKATVYYPLGEIHRTQPVVVFAHGFAAWKELYTWIASSLVIRGYIILLFTVPNTLRTKPNQWSDGIISAIDYLQSESPLSQMICTEKYGAMGHSIGGLGALIASSEDTRIGCVVGLAPAILPKLFPIPQQVSEMLIPIQFQIGNRDGIISVDNVKTFYNELSSKKKSLIEIEGGNHIQFVDKRDLTQMAEYIAELGKLFRDNTAKASFEEQHMISSNSFLEWFRMNLCN